MFCDDSLQFCARTLRLKMCDKIYERWDLNEPKSQRAGEGKIAKESVNVLQECLFDDFFLSFSFCSFVLSLLFTMRPKERSFLGAYLLRSLKKGHKPKDCLQCTRRAGSWRLFLYISLLTLLPSHLSVFSRQKRKFVRIGPTYWFQSSLNSSNKSKKRMGYLHRPFLFLWKIEFFLALVFICLSLSLSLALFTHMHSTSYGSVFILILIFVSFLFFSFSSSSSRVWVERQRERAKERKRERERERCSRKERRTERGGTVSCNWNKLLEGWTFSAR